MRLIAVIVFLFAFSVSGASNFVGSGASVPLPSSALFGTWPAYIPADGEAVRFNPPHPWHFPAWPQSTLISNVAHSYEAYWYEVQVSTNEFAYTNAIYTITNNNVTFAHPITNANGTLWAGSNYWRVLYRKWGSSTLVYTSPIKHHTLASATEWNKAAIITDSVMMNIGTNHPHCYIEFTNRASISNYFFNPSSYTWNGDTAVYGENWATITNEAVFYRQYMTTNGITNAPAYQSPPFYNMSGASFIALNAFAYVISSNAFWIGSNESNLIECALSMLRQARAEKMYFNYDSYHDGGVWTPFSLTYDWLYNDMTADQRTEYRGYLEERLMFLMRQANYPNGVYQFYDMDAEITAGTYMGSPLTFALTPKLHFGSPLIAGSSHDMANIGEAMSIVIAIMGESSIARQLAPDVFSIAATRIAAQKFAGGRSYAFAQLQSPGKMWNATTLFQVTFRHYKMTNYIQLAGHWTQGAYIEPPYIQESLGYFGNLGPVANHGFMFVAVVDSLARMTKDGALLRAGIRAREAFAPGNGSPSKSQWDSWGILADAWIPYYFSAPSQADYTSRYYFNPEHGVLVVGDLQPNDWGAFTNATCWQVMAPPFEHKREGEMVSDLSAQVTRRGAAVTVASGGSAYGKHGMFANGLGVDGIFPCTPIGHATEPWYMRFEAVTNGGSWFYARAEGAKAYNRSNYNAAGGTAFHPGVAYTESSNKRPYLVSMTLNVFQTNNAMVYCATMVTTQAATLHVKFNVPSYPTSIDSSNHTVTYPCTNMNVDVQLSSAVTTIGTGTASNQFTAPGADWYLYVEVSGKLTNSTTFVMPTLSCSNVTAFFPWTNAQYTGGGYLSAVEGGVTNWYFNVGFFQTNVTPTLSSITATVAHANCTLTLKTMKRLANVIATRKVIGPETNLMTIVEAGYDNNFTNRFTGEYYQLPETQPRWPLTLWTFNKVPATNVTISWVITMQDYTNATPFTIGNLDAFTVGITNGPDQHAFVVAYRTNAASADFAQSASDFVFDTGSSLEAPPAGEGGGGEDPPATPGRTLRAIRATAGRVVK